jgi:ribosomal 50S subunit-recycling heat shock protein
MMVRVKRVMVVRVMVSHKVKVMVRVKRVKVNHKVKVVDRIKVSHNRTVLTVTVVVVKAERTLREIHRTVHTVKVLRTKRKRLILGLSTKFSITLRRTRVSILTFT